MNQQPPPIPANGTFYSLEAALAQPEAVTKLDLRNQNLTELDPRIEQCYNLEVLHLGGNQLTDLPLELQRCMRLHTLALNNNQLTRLPVVVTTLQNLVSLTLAGNLLYTLPDDMAALYQLQQLNVSGNRMPHDEERKLINNLPQATILFRAGPGGKYIANQPGSYWTRNPTVDKWDREENSGKRVLRIVLAIIGLGILAIRIIIRLS